MSDQYDGADVVDESGEKVGTVQASYEDDSGSLRYVQVKTGGLLAKHHLVPVDDLEREADRLVLPYEKNVVDNSPDVPGRADELDEVTGKRVRAYYGGVRSRYQGSSNEPEKRVTEQDLEMERPASVPLSAEGSVRDVTGDASDEGTAVSGKGEEALAYAQDAESSGKIGEIRDLGDVIEVPIIEEELIKRPVVKEVLRIRKTQLVESQTVQTDVRREDVEVRPDSDVEVRDDT